MIGKKTLIGHLIAIATVKIYRYPSVKRSHVGKVSGSDILIAFICQSVDSLYTSVKGGFVGAFIKCHKAGFCTEIYSYVKGVFYNYVVAMIAVYLYFAVTFYFC